LLQKLSLQENQVSTIESESVKLPVRERLAMGRALREQAPREAHAEFQLSPNGRDVVAILEESNEGRLPELVPIRYGRMLADSFAFLRGSAALMAHDLSTTPATGIQVQACGDCHLANFGLFATPERNLVFDLNDFDETLPGSWEWDIKRLAASFVVAGRKNGFSKEANKATVLSLAHSYQKHLRAYTKMRVLDVWYSRLDDQTLIATAPSAKSRANRKRITAKARTSVAEYLFPKITTVEAGRYRIVDQPPLITHLSNQNITEVMVQTLMTMYWETLPDHLRELFRHYHFHDFAFKVVGVGSVGTRCFVLLFLAGRKDPLLLQAKEARPSVLEAYAGKSQFAHEGQRIVTGQRLMQSASDMFLGWVTGLAGEHYYMRQLRDMKFSFPVYAMRPSRMVRYAAICGWVLARAHAKAGDAAMISGYLGRSDVFGRALAEFARAYADQTEQDYHSLVEAARSGRVEAVLDQ
jgi:uncharacterized protein (DUF2252 family)